MKITQNSKLKTQNYIYKLKTFAPCVLVLLFAFCTLHSPVLAISPTPTLIKATPIASPSAGLTPTTAEEEKVQEIRQAIKDKLTEIKDKIEKKAYVGTILEITDSTLSLTNFRGKRRVRLSAETTIIGGNKKEVTIKDLAVEDKVIAMGEVDANGTLEAKRVIVVPKPLTPPIKRLIFYGTVTEINSKTSTITLTNIKNLDQTLAITVDKNTKFVNLKDTKVETKLKDLITNQKLIVIYPEPAQGKTAVAKTIFILP